LSRILERFIDFLAFLVQKLWSKIVVFNLGVTVPVGVVCHFFGGSRELLIKIFIIFSEFHLSYL